MLYSKTFFPYAITKIGQLHHLLYVFHNNYGIVNTQYQCRAFELKKKHTDIEADRMYRQRTLSRKSRQLKNH